MNVEAIALPQPLLEQMAATKQNPRYHAEGDVLAHTRLVVQCFEDMKSQFKLTPSEEKVLLWAAYLHDVGKVEVTRFEGNRWRSPGHERAGLPLARNLVYQRDALSPEEQRQVLDLVRWHGLPLKFMLENKPLELLKQLGIRTNLRLLGIFSAFDLFGRKCHDQERIEGLAMEFVQQKVPQAEYELGSYSDLQTAFASWNLRHKNAAWNALQMGNVRLIERLLAADPVQEYQTRGKKVYFTIGPPRCGKSDWIERELPGTFHVRLFEHGFDAAVAQDSYLLGRKLVEFKHMLVIYLNRHRHVVLEGWNLDEEVRRRLIEMIRDQEVELEYLVFHAALDTVRERNLAAAEPIAEDELAAAYHGWDLIHPWEAHATRHIHF